MKGAFFCFVPFLSVAQRLLRQDFDHDYPIVMQTSLLLRPKTQLKFMENTVLSFASRDRLSLM